MSMQSAERQETQEFSTLAEVRKYLLDYSKGNTNVNITADTASFTIGILNRLWVVNPENLSNEDVIDLHYFMHNTIQYQYAKTNASMLEKRKFIINLLSTSDVSWLNADASQEFNLLVEKLKELWFNLDSLNNEASQISGESKEVTEGVSNSAYTVLEHKAHSA